MKLYKLSLLVMAFAVLSCGGTREPRQNSVVIKQLERGEKAAVKAEEAAREAKDARDEIVQAVESARRLTQMSRDNLVETQKLLAEASILQTKGNDKSGEEIKSDWEALKKKLGEQSQKQGKLYAQALSKPPDEPHDANWHPVKKAKKLLSYDKSKQLAALEKTGEMTDDDVWVAYAVNQPKECKGKKFGNKLQGKWVLSGLEEESSCGGETGKEIVYPPITIEQLGGCASFVEKQTVTSYLCMAENKNNFNCYSLITAKSGITPGAIEMHCDYESAGSFTCKYYMKITKGDGCQSFGKLKATRIK